MRILAVASLGAAVLAAACASQEPRVPQAAVDVCAELGLCPYPFTGYGVVPATAGAPVAATSLIGTEIVDREGRHVGRIDDLAIDLPAQRVRYAILTLTGAGVGEDRRGVPLEALERALADDQLVLAPGEHPGAAPAGEATRVVRASSLMGRALEGPDGQRLGRIRDVIVELDSARAPYAIVRAEQRDEGLRAVGLARVVPDPVRAQARLVSTGAPASAEPGEARASELLGRPVHAEAGERLGEIAALLLDSRARGVHLVMLETAAGERIAYPVSALRREAGRLLLAEERTAHPQPQARYQHASKLLGRAAEDPLGNTIGKVRDIAVSLDSGRTRYVLVEFSAEATVLPLAPHLVRLRPGANPVVTGDPHRRG
ncbi:MAG TPA: PRC-barrel domain-containing protein [Burkholderiales bacterium]